jgi:hypothetical protein
LLPERIVSLKIGEAYTNLRAVLLENGCKVLSEQSPKQISVKQGSLWGITPKTAKKTLNINLETIDSGTRVTYSSKLASDWKNITVVGCILAAVLVGVCVWIASDLSAFMVTAEPSFWSWILGNMADLQAGQAFVNLSWGLAVFLLVIILLEIAIVAYVHSKIDTFAQETLSSIKKKG